MKTCKIFTKIFFLKKTLSFFDHLHFLQCNQDVWPCSLPSRFLYKKKADLKWHGPNDERCFQANKGQKLCRKTRQSSSENPLVNWNNNILKSILWLEKSVSFQYLIYKYIEGMLLLGPLASLSNLSDHYSLKDTL